MRFISYEKMAEYFAGKTVAIVGSAPSCLDNDGAFIDGHDIVVRINNYKTRGFEDRVGKRTDVHYSFYGTSIRKTANELREDGVKLCVGKCPNAKFMESEWHAQRDKPHGVDFRYIYTARAAWWFTYTFVPSVEQFNLSFNALEQHIPSTGFACLYEILPLRWNSLYITGFDFFSSSVHNVDEPWRAGDPSDPIGHSPERELAWLKNFVKGSNRNIECDRRLRGLIV